MADDAHGLMDTSQNREEKMQSDVAEAKKTLVDLCSHAESSLKSVDVIAARIEDGFSTAKGLSFLEVKNHMLLSYLIDLTYLIYRKSTGKSISEDSAVDRLAESRTVLEKMRPIDQKLKYQIEKVIRVVTDKSINPSDPLRFHANPKNLSTKSDGESGSDDGSDDQNKTQKSKTKPKAYVPPKLSAVYYGDETKEEQRQRILERARKRALNTSIMQELRREYNDGPEEIIENHDLHRVREDRRRKEKDEYEEKYMTRLNVTRQEKHRATRIATMSSLAELSHFEDISALEANPEEFPMKKKKLAKSGQKYKKGKKGFRKKRH